MDGFIFKFWFFDRISRLEDGLLVPALPLEMVLWSDLVDEFMLG